tara:strand:+ start:675 stop:1802 length:1128 start_codon:yes stop_codon:yes gene_type:complete
MDSIIQQIFHHRLIQVTQLYTWVTVLTLNFLIVNVCFGSVGKVSYQSQPAQIIRSNDKILTEKGTLINMDDVIETLNGVVHLVFEDNTKVKIKEYSELVIDDFVYEPNTKKGKLNLKASLGNIRYTSGLIANKENIKISTPTASVSVRGTDFNITVSESGKSSFTLLPSLDSFGNEYTGKIEVSNISGSVLLTIPFENTVVTSMISPPTPPVVLSRTNISKFKKQEQKEKEDKEADEEAEEEAEEDEGDDSKEDNNDKKEDGDKKEAEPEAEPEPEPEPEEDQTDVEEGINEEELIEREQEIIAFEKIIVSEQEAKSIFTEIDNRIYFIAEENQNKVSISFDPTSSVSVNYENQGTFISGDHNNGGQVIINIIQQ